MGQARVVSISTNKGGVLKTSIVLNIASVLAKKGKKVLIIDTDNQGNISLGFGFNPDVFEVTIYDVLVEDYEIKNAVFNVYNEKTKLNFETDSAMKNIDILPANDDMAFFEFDVLTQKGKNPRFNRHFDLLKDKLKGVLEDYQYILIDTPPNIGATVGNVLNCSDEVIVPYKPETFSMRSTLKILRHIQSFANTENPNLKINGILPTDVRYTNHHRDNIIELKKYIADKGLGINVFAAEIPNSVKYDENIKNERNPLIFTQNQMILKKYSKLIDVYYNLVEEAFGIG